MSYLEILKAQLVTDEGKRNSMYLDSVGIPTIGIGHNLKSKPISDRAVDVIFEDDVAEAEKQIRRIIPSFDSLTDNRKAVVLNMLFNLGEAGFTGFGWTRELIAQGRYGEAADAMLKSLWARQVGDRAKRLSYLMRKG
jgi:lysozyme